MESDDDELAPLPTPTQEKKRAKRMISKNKPKHTIRDLKRNQAKKTLVSQQGFDTNESAFSASCNKRLRVAKRHHKINSRIGINPDITTRLVNTRLLGDPQTARRPQIGKPTGLGLVSSSNSQIPQEIADDHKNDCTNILAEFHKHMLKFLFKLVDQFPEDNHLFAAPSTVTLELKRKDLAPAQRPSTFYIIQEFLVNFYKGPGSTMYKWVTVDKNVDCADMVHRAVLLDELLLPRCRIGRMFMKKVAAMLKLLAVQLDAKLNMHDCSTALSSHNNRIANQVINALPARECCTHRGADEQHRLLRPDLGHGAVPHLLAIKVPRLAIHINSCQI